MRPFDSPSGTRRSLWATAVWFHRLLAAAWMFAIVVSTRQIVTAETRAVIQLQPAVGQSRTGFEAVDVHVSAPEETRRVLHTDAATFSGGQYEIRNATMLDLITTAYSVEEAAVFGGPSWLALDRFDVIAKPPAKTTIAAANVMLQSVLADRFKLAVRKDTKPLPAWVLSAGADKPKLKPADNAAESACRTMDSNQRVTCTNVTMDAFAAWLRAGRITTLPVVNSTNIEGSWNFDLHYTVAGGMFGVAENNPIIDALAKEVGLKLEVQNVPQAVLIVEGVNRNPTANAPDLAKSLPQVRTEFEAASIRPCKAFQPGPEPSREQVNTGCVPLSSLVAQAWNLSIQIQMAPNLYAFLGPNIVGLPNWINSRFFEIVAKAPVGFDFRGPRGQANWRAMLRNLLVDRFKMVTHYEDRLVDAYTLVAAKPKLKKADPSTRTECRSTGIVVGVPTVVKCQNVTMAQFVEELNHQQPIVASGRRVVDSTSIEGSWDFTFSYRIVPGRTGAPGEAADPAGGVSLFDALDQQLGLKLEGAKRSMPVFVIDRIEETPTEN